MPADARAFDPGCMIFINTDETHPRAAIGAIISGDCKGCTALMARTEFGEGDIVYIRDGKACIPARLDRKL
jgi:sarcosine oxidase subunit alpha